MGEIIEAILNYLYNIPEKYQMIFAIVFTYFLVSKSYDKFVRKIYIIYRRSINKDSKGDVRGIDPYKDSNSKTSTFSEDKGGKS